MITSRTAAARVEGNTTPAFRALVARLRGPAAIYLLAGILTRVGFIILIPLYSRKLDAEAYGDYVLAQNALGLAPALVLGLPAALSLYYFDSPDREVSRRRVGAVAKMNVMATLCVVALLEPLILGLVPASVTGLFSRWSLTCVLIAAAGSVLALIPVQFFRDSQKPVVAAAFQLAEFVLIVGTGIWFVSTLGRGLPGSLEALAATYSLLGAASIVFTYGYLGGTLSRGIVKEVLRFSLPYVAHFSALWIQSVADRWTMKVAKQGASLGPYALANQLSTPSTMVVNAWNLERGPRTGELFRGGGLAAIRRDMRRMVVSYMVASAVPSIGIIAATPLLRLFISSSFYSALVYLPALLLFNFIDALYLPSFLVVYYASKSRWISVVTTVSAIASIALSAVFVPVFGVWGAVAAHGMASLVRTSSIGFAASRCLALAKAGDEARQVA